MIQWSALHIKSIHRVVEGLFSMNLYINRRVTELLELEETSVGIWSNLCAQS